MSVRGIALPFLGQLLLYMNACLFPEASTVVGFRVAFPRVFLTHWHL